MATAAHTRRRYGQLAWVGIVALAAFGAFWVAKKQAEGPNKAIAPPPVGLPHTPDYHSLLVDPTDPNRILLGTHVGIYESTSGGRSWTFAKLEGDDAMNLVQTSESTIWLAGHNVFKRTTDAGATWQDVRPEGLPGLDIHGFAADPTDQSVLYAAVAGEGLYRSEDGGRSFAQVSKGVGPAVYGLAVAPSGRVLAAEQRGVLASEDGGTRWTFLLEESSIGLAVNPSDPDTILAGGRRLERSTDGGRTWQRVLDVEEGIGPIAWAPSDPAVAYAVGLDRKLYRSRDTGASWKVVA